MPTSTTTAIVSTNKKNANAHASQATSAAYPPPISAVGSQTGTSLSTLQLGDGRCNASTYGGGLIEKWGAWMAFDGITIPAGATLTSATVSTYFRSRQSNSNFTATAPVVAMVGASGPTTNTVPATPITPTGVINGTGFSPISGTGGWGTEEEIPVTKFTGTGISNPSAAQFTNNVVINVQPFVQALVDKFGAYANGRMVVSMRPSSSGADTGVNTRSKVTMHQIYAKKFESGGNKSPRIIIVYTTPAPVDKTTYVFI